MDREKKQSCSGSAGRGLFFTLVLALFLAWSGSALAGQEASSAPAPAVAPATAPATLAGGPTEYVIGLGDLLQIMVWKEPELTMPMSVRIDGRISLPLIGDVQAAGKTIRDLKKVLEEKYAAVIEEPAVSVMLTQSKSWRYYIIGQIRQPGEFPIDFPITVLQAIARSGGFLEWAKKDRISIVRHEAGHETIAQFNYEALVNGQNLLQNALVQPGDTIIIP
jgi:polysaccharide export outer membrane protein